MSVEVANDDESHAQEVPLRQFCPGRQRNFGRLVDQKDAVLGELRASRLPVLVQNVHDGAAIDEASRCVSNGAVEVPDHDSLCLVQSLQLL